MRLRAIIMKELRAVREDPSFHLAALSLRWMRPLAAFSVFRLAGSSCWAGWRWRRCWPLRSIIENWRVLSDKTLQNSADDKILIIGAVLFMAKNAQAD